MKVLSVQQPWASLICSGIKDVENRSWKTAKAPGRILIHAGSKAVTKNFKARIPEVLVSFIDNHISFGNIPEIESWPTSAIIGYVTVTGFDDGIVDSVWADGPGVYKWKLEDAWLFDEPILNVKGKLHLFDYDLDEDNLPPAHQVQLENVEVNDDESDVQIPCTKDKFEKIKTGEFGGMVFNLTPYLTDLLCVDDAYRMKPFKTVTVYSGNSYLSFELGEESGIYALPDPQDESRPYYISDLIGNESVWMVAKFMFGKKLEEDEFELDDDETVSFCGGLTCEILKDLENLLAQEEKGILKIKVNKDTFDKALRGKLGMLTEAITPKNLSSFFILNDKDEVKEVNGIPQLKPYESIQLCYKQDSCTFLINNADVIYLDPEYNEYTPYSELENDNIEYTDCMIAYSLGEKCK